MGGGLQGKWGALRWWDKHERELSDLEYLVRQHGGYQLRENTNIGNTFKIEKAEERPPPIKQVPQKGKNSAPAGKH